MAGALALAMASTGSMPALASASALADGQADGGGRASTTPRPGAGDTVGAMATHRTVGMDTTPATPTTAMYMRTITYTAAGRALPMAAISAGEPEEFVAAARGANRPALASNRPATALNRRAAGNPDAAVQAWSPIDRAMYSSAMAMDN